MYIEAGITRWRNGGPEHVAVINPCTPGLERTRDTVTATPCQRELDLVRSSDFVIVTARAAVLGLPRARRWAGDTRSPAAVRIFLVIRGPWVQAGPCSGGRQDESDRASRTHSRQSGVDCGHRVVVPVGYASHADRAWADGQAAAAHPPWDARRQLHAVRRADESSRESNRRTAWPRRSRIVSQIPKLAGQAKIPRFGAVAHFWLVAPPRPP